MEVAPFTLPGSVKSLCKGTALRNYACALSLTKGPLSEDAGGEAPDPVSLKFDTA